MSFRVFFCLQLAGAGALAAAVFTEIKFKDLDQVQATVVEQTSSTINNQDNLFLKTEATAGLVFATAGVAGLFGFAALVGRICNAEHDSANRCIFSTLVGVYSCGCGVKMECHKMN